MRIAVVGGGINGVMAAWELARRGHHVRLFERARLMGATSSASSKLLHGGLRYLEQLDLPLVYESLHERAWWLAHAPQLARPLELFLPVYRDTPRHRLTLRTGLVLYDLLAAGAAIGRHRWWPAADLPPRAHGVRRAGLIGAFSYWDACMDDRALGLWAAARAHDAGVAIEEHAPVARIVPDGTLGLGDGRTMVFDAIVNAAGPWARALLDRSGVATRTRLDLVRGSHLVLARPLDAGIALQLPRDRRLVFVLPYQGQTLVGTTEVRQALDDPIACSPAERAYLLDAYNQVMAVPADDGDVVATFAGVRPLVDSGLSPHAQRRGALIETTGRLVSVFGGKWTTARALGVRVAERVEQVGRCRQARL